MTLRVFNLVVIALLILAAAYVYRIKFDSTVQAERLAKIRGELRRERDAIAALRAQWGELDNPARIEALAERYLPLKPVAPTQFSQFNQLPDRPPQFFKTDGPDPIGAAVDQLNEAGSTGSIAAPDVKAAPPDDAPAAVPDAATEDTGDAVPNDADDGDGATAGKSGRLDR